MFTTISFPTALYEEDETTGHVRVQTRARERARIREKLMLSNCKTAEARAALQLVLEGGQRLLENRHQRRKQLK